MVGWFFFKLTGWHGAQTHGQLFWAGGGAKLQAKSALQYDSKSMINNFLTLSEEPRLGHQ